MSEPDAAGRRPASEPAPDPGAARTPLPEVVIYGRPGCHLCEDALAALHRVRARRDFNLVEVDIESDDRLLAALLERIPVVELDGRELFEFFVDEELLERHLRGGEPSIE